MQYHIKNWMMDTGRELLSIQNRILTSPNEEERSYLKSKYDTLSSVLQLLQKQKLEEKLQVQTRINQDLKLFIKQSHRQRAEFQLDLEQKSHQALRRELKEVQLKIYLLMR